MIREVFAHMHDDGLVVARPRILSGTCRLCGTCSSNRKRVIETETVFSGRGPFAPVPVSLEIQGGWKRGLELQAFADAMNSTLRLARDDD